jgi:hypothetical protein
VHAHDFGRPIVTFSTVDGSPDCIWVSLDAHWTDEGQSPAVNSHMRLVRLTLDSVHFKGFAFAVLFSYLNHLGERSISSATVTVNPEWGVGNTRYAHLHPLFCVVVSHSYLLTANEREIAALQLYEPLTSLPKNIDATHNPMIRDAPDDSDTANKAKGNRSAKAAGKMRTRMALLERSTEDEPAAKKTKGGRTEGIGEAMDAS